MQILNPGDQTTPSGSDVSFSIGFSSVGAPPVSYSVSGLPSGLSLNVESDEILRDEVASIGGTITPGAAGDYTVTVTASDGSDSSSFSFSWIVTSEFQLSDPGDQTSTDGSQVDLAVQTTGALGLPLTYSASGLPPGLSVNATTGIVSGTISAQSFVNSPYHVTLTASDAAESSSVSWDWHVSSFGAAP